MKITKRAQTLLSLTNYNSQNAPALCSLVIFAAQNSGLDPRDYGTGAEGFRAYRKEARDISNDLKRFKAALLECFALGVQDNDIISEAPHAFSGRLEPVATCRLWGSEVYKVTGSDETGFLLASNKDGAKPASHQTREVCNFAWNYCTGQYFPTEYRKAAATLLEAAARKVRQARPAKKQMPRTIAELKQLNRENGGCWFSKDTMRFFGTRIESGILFGSYFITSEQPPHGSRKYSVRSFDETGSVESVGEFCSHASKREAVEALHSHIAQLESQRVAA